MVFISKNLDRKCKYCENQRKKNVVDGVNKGYNRTCGSKECLRKHYDDVNCCVMKGRVKKPKNFICYVCEKPFNQTSANHKRYCLECVPDKSWTKRAHRYLIGKKQWDILLEKQNGLCALCNKIPEVVDHCHQSGRIRGLLCNSCNVNLKFLEKDLNFLKTAFRYLGKDYAFQE